MSDAFADMNRKVMAEFRANGGKVGGFFEGATLVILHTTGARTGRGHETPLMTWTDAGRLHVIASAAGAPRHPAWFHNLTANPSVTVELGTETFEATAVEITGSERDRIYDDLKAAYPNFAEYEERVAGGRVIPVVALDRV